MYIFFALTLFLPMLAFKKRREGDPCILDTRSTTCIKGILCIYVMLHNLGLDLENSEFKELVCEHAGGVGVGLFFFLSAFGIIRSYQARGNKYLTKLLFVHIPKLWGVAVFINVITYLSFSRGAYESTDMWLRILNLDLFNGFNRINRHGWYIASIIALYVIFALVYFLCSKLKTDKKIHYSMRNNVSRVNRLQSCSAYCGQRRNVHKRNACLCDRLYLRHLLRKNQRYGKEILCLGSVGIDYSICFRLLVL